MVKVTSIIIHYNRPENISRIIEGIRKQTIQSEIWVWDNSSNCPGNSCPASGIDVLVRSNKNFHCLPRFVLSSMVQSPYIFNQDDDMYINDSKLFEKLIAVSEKYPDDFIGWNGRQMTQDINWEYAYQFPGKGWVGKCDTDNVQVMNVGVSFFKTELLEQIPRNPYRNGIRNVTEREYKFGDDIWISSFLKRRRITSFLENSITLMDEKGVGLSKQTDHMIVRNELCRRYYKEKK